MPNDTVSPLERELLAAAADVARRLRRSAGEVCLSTPDELAAADLLEALTKRLAAGNMCRSQLPRIAQESDMSKEAKIAAARKTTQIVEESVIYAFDRLEGNFAGRLVNGHDVYSDPSRHEQALASVIARLTEARERMRATAWPTCEDYDA